MRFSIAVPGRPPSRIALFPGAWNPPTVAHLAMARVALAHADEIVWTLPRRFPHKAFDGRSFDQRLEMLCRIARTEGEFSVAVADGGLYFEMAEEAREYIGPEPEISLLCGRDAAERIATWDYGCPGVFDAMVEKYPLLVAGRAGGYLPHPAMPNASCRSSSTSTRSPPPKSARASERRALAASGATRDCRSDRKNLHQLKNVAHAVDRLGFSGMSP